MHVVPAPWLRAKIGPWLQAKIAACDGMVCFTYGLFFMSVRFCEMLFRGLPHMFEMVLIRFRYVLTCFLEYMTFVFNKVFSGVVRVLDICVGVCF